MASALDRDAPLDASLKKVLRKTEEEIEERRAIESAVDAREWRVELERVAAKLKAASKRRMPRIGAPTWTRAARRTRRCAPSSLTFAWRWTAWGASVRRWWTRLKLASRTSTPGWSRGRTSTSRRWSRWSRRKKAYDEGNERVSSLTNELARIGERLERAKGDGEQRGRVERRDSLTKLRDVVDKMSEEMRTMEVKIAIARNALGHASMRRAASGGTGRAGAAAAAAAL